MPSFVIELPYTRPPLTLNQKMHWAVKAKLTRQVRSTVCSLARQARIGQHEQVDVVLEYTPRDSRRRDRDNLVATLKPCLDGLVDAGLVPDDSPQFLSWSAPVICPPDPSAPGLRLRVTVP